MTDWDPCHNSAHCISSFYATVSRLSDYCDGQHDIVYEDVGRFELWHVLYMKTCYKNVADNGNQ